ELLRSEDARDRLASETPRGERPDALDFRRETRALRAACKPGMIVPERRTDQQPRIEPGRVELCGAERVAAPAPHRCDRRHDATRPAGRCALIVPVLQAAPHCAPSPAHPRTRRAPRPPSPAAACRGSD